MWYYLYFVFWENISKFYILASSFHLQEFHLLVSGLQTSLYFLQNPYILENAL